MNYNDVEYVVKTLRAGKEIKLENSLFNNDNITVKLGTAEDKKKPKTIYINISFWTEVKNKPKELDEWFDKNISREYKINLKEIYKNDLNDLLNQNEIFPYYFDNIYICDSPDNINYNNKRSFTTIELNLHTLNCKEDIEPIPLKKDNNNKLYNESLKIINIISNSDLLQNKLKFTIHKHKKD